MTFLSDICCLKECIWEAGVNSANHFGAETLRKMYLPAQKYACFEVLYTKLYFIFSWIAYICCKYFKYSSSLLIISQLWPWSTTLKVQWIYLSHDTFTPLQFLRLYLNGGLTSGPLSTYGRRKLTLTLLVADSQRAVAHLMWWRGLYKMWCVASSSVHWV